MMRPPHMAENTMQPTATSATKFLNLSFTLMPAYYSTNAVAIDYGRNI